MRIEPIDAATLAALLATVISISCTWPQIARIRRTGDIAGVSITAATLTVSSEIGWTVYLAGEGLWPAIPEGVFNIAANVVLALALVRHGGSYRRAVALAAAWITVLLMARGAGGPSAIAALLAAAYAVQLTPAVVTAWRTWSPSGISVTTWTLRLVEAGLWGAFGLVRGDPPLILFGVFGTTESAAILVRKAVTRNRTAHADLAGVETAQRATGPSQQLKDAVVG